MRKLLIIASLMCAMPAMAQPRPIDKTALLQRIQADAKASVDDADQHGDKISSACWAAIHQAATVKLQAQSVTGGGVMLVFQKFRDLTRLSSTPQGTDLIIGCAPLAQDAKLNLLDLFTKFGAMVLVKGLLVP